MDTLVSDTLMDFVDTCILEIFGAALLAFGVLFKAAISCEAASHNSPGPPSGDLSLFSLPLSLSLPLVPVSLPSSLPPSLPASLHLGQRCSKKRSKNTAALCANASMPLSFAHRCRLASCAAMCVCVFVHAYIAQLQCSSRMVQVWN